MKLHRLKRLAPTFYEAFMALGKTDSERAYILGVSHRTVVWWLAGRCWPSVKALRHWPNGLRALADDFDKRESE